MAKPRDNRQKDLLRPALEDIIDLAHPLVRLAREIDWQFLDSRFASVCTSGRGQPLELEQQTGVENRRIHVDKGYRATITKRSSASGSAARFRASPNPFA